MSSGHCRCVPAWAAIYRARHGLGSVLGFSLDAIQPPLYDAASSGPLAQLVEQLTFNQWVTGSNPVRLTTEFPEIITDT